MRDKATRGRQCPHLLENDIKDNVLPLLRLQKIPLNGPPVVIVAVKKDHSMIDDDKDCKCLSLMVFNISLKSIQVHLVVRTSCETS